MTMLALSVLAVAARGLTCDASAIDPRSWALTTRAQALNVAAPRYRWWDAFDIGKHEWDLADLNENAARLADRARAEEAMRAVMDSGGTVVWTATLYDVDARTYFALAFDRGSSSTGRSTSARTERASRRSCARSR
jgi:hypothetical protein